MLRIDHAALRAVAIGATIAFDLAAGQARAAQPLPGSVQPGQIERNFRPQPAPKSTLQPLVIPAVPEKRLPPAEAKAIHFTLSHLVITGATVYKPADFLPLYKAELGKTLSLADLYKIADAVTAKYRDDGYILSQAYVPAQTIDDGVARIAVVEGYVDQVRFKGEIKGRQGLFDQYRDKIEASRPLSLSVLERYLLLMGDLAGVKVRSLFEPSPTTPGASTLIVILENKPVDAQIGLDNRGTASLGPVELNVNGALNDGLRLYERTDLALVMTPQDSNALQYYRLEHAETLDSEGTKLSVAATYVKTNPGDTLAPLDVQGNDGSASVTLSHPFIRSRQQNLYGSVNFTYRNTTTDELGVKTADDRIRSVAISGSYDFSDAWRGVTQLRTTLDNGLSIFGATPNDNPLASRTRGKTDFTKVEFYASRLQQLLGRWSALAQATGQVSADPLLAPEQFAIGGEPFGRAYDPSEITGDSGVAGSLEVDYSPPISPAFVKGAQLFGFYGIGEVFNRIPTIGNQGDFSAASAGFGFRLKITDHLTAAADVDKPLTRAPAVNGNKGWRAFFRVAAGY